MLKTIEIQQPDGTTVQREVIECHGDCKEPAHIRIHIDPKAKKKKKPTGEQLVFELKE